MPNYITMPGGQVVQANNARLREWLTKSNSTHTLAADEDAVQLLTRFLQTDKTWRADDQQAFVRAFDSYVDQIAVLRAVMDVCDRIVKDFPAQRYDYIGIGRSPAPFIAGLKNMRCRTFSVPLSAFRPANVTPSFTDDLLRVGPRSRITPEQQQKLFAHFDARFDGKVMRPRVVMLDYTQGGRAVVAAMEQLQAYFDRRKLTIEVHALAICGPSEAATVMRNIGERMSAQRQWHADPYDWWYNSEARARFGKRWHIHALGELNKQSRRERLLHAALKRESFEGVAEFTSFKLLQDEQFYQDYVANFGDYSGFEALREALANCRTL